MTTKTTKVIVYNHYINLQSEFKRSKIKFLEENHPFYSNEDDLPIAYIVPADGHGHAFARDDRFTPSDIRFPINTIYEIYEEPMDEEEW